MRRLLPLLLFALLLGWLLPGGAVSARSSVSWPGNPFSPASFWNRRLAANAPLARFSGRYVRDLLRQVRRSHAWMNTTAYSVPVYVVPRREPTRQVTLDTWAPALQRAFDHVPVPRGARAAAGTDASMTVWQPSSNRLWDFWQMHKVDGRWHARWGGEMSHVSRNPGYFTRSARADGWGATASGLPLLGGLVTFADLRRGYINHALAIAIVQAAAGKYSWPAERTDGTSVATGTRAIPEGMRFRLSPHLNIARLHLPTIDRMLAQAAQRYGVVVRDQAGAVVFYGQDPVTRAVNPWPAAFGHQYPNQVLARFPWSRLEALRPRMACCS